MKTSTFILSAALISAVAFPIGVWANTQTDHIISQKKRKYAPTAITIKAGESLTVVNDDIFLHHAFVDAENMQYDSGSMEEGDQRTVAFNTPGEYQLLCAIHPKMKLAVTVE